MKTSIRKIATVIALGLCAASAWSAEPATKGSDIPSQDPFVVPDRGGGPPPGGGAARGGGRGANVAAMVAQLDRVLALTDDQKKQITAIYQSNMPANLPGRGGPGGPGRAGPPGGPGRGGARGGNRGAPPADGSAKGGAATDGSTGDATKKGPPPPPVANGQQKIHDAIRAVLTPEQQAKFDAMPATGRGGPPGRGGQGGQGVRGGRGAPGGRAGANNQKV